VAQATPFSLLRGVRPLMITLMRRRFLADEVLGDTAFLTGQNAAHLARVLRARVGQQFEIVAAGVVRLGSIVNVVGERVQFALGEEVHSTELRPIKLLLAIFKFDRMEWAIEKATELGVTEIIPFVARRTDAHLVTAAGKRVERWRRIAHEASQQSRRVSPPEIRDTVKLKEAVAIAADMRIVLAESEEDRMLRDLVGTSGSVALAFGPEGGWTTEELDAFEKAGWIFASLGPTILRAETAVVAATAITAALRE
jgi:16S rRNA (uracil1498-N3)-methyltransferase